MNIRLLSVYLLLLLANGGGLFPRRAFRVFRSILRRIGEVFRDRGVVDLCGQL